MARGFTQSFGVDYEETFAPVAKLNTVRVLLSLAVNLNWSLGYQKCIFKWGPKGGGLHECTRRGHY